jgi:mRNA interferase RelE/StbE
MYHVEFSEQAVKSLKKLDPQIARLILAWIAKNLDQTEHPRQFGKALVGNKQGVWRYRIGDYRLLVHIVDDRLIVLVVDVGHRKEIYNTNE